VIARQHQGSAKGFVFQSLEVEAGIANILLAPDLFEQNRIVVVDHVDTESMEPFQPHNLESLRGAINLRNKGFSEFGHIPPEGADHDSEATHTALNSKELLVGLQGFEPRTKGL
jgi:hypothetical protein